MVVELQNQGDLSKDVCVGVFTKEGCKLCESLAGKISNSVGGYITVYLISYEKYPLLFKTFNIDPDKIVKDPIGIIFKYGKEVDRISKGIPQTQIAKKIINTTKKAR